MLIENSNELTVREYARREGITLQSVYRRIWDGQVQAKQLYGRWLISPEQNNQPTTESAVA